MIEINHLVKKYGDHYAVKDLSFQVEKGQIYGFLGPNGAGKSTTMNIVTGYLAPTSGEVKVGGIDIMKDAENAKKKIGYLPEIPPVYPEMTVEEYMTFAAELKKIPKKDRKRAVLDACQMTGILEVQHRLIGNLSKGYKQRVGLAQAVLGGPEIIILDEPTVGLDPKQIIEIRELILSLKEKHTVILSSHILSEVSAVCDQILILSKGELVASDTPEALQKRMQKQSDICVTVRGEKENLLQIVNGMDGVEAVRVIKESCDDGSGEVEISITQMADCDIREELFYKLAENRMPIMNLHADTKSLEDIFLQLTEEEHNNDSDI
ncbi:MAG: ABC transporter ATP-binding protein [Lachnospiraceae bacterium]|nr:ABC transporter ATP-binding protein [Lachnospiraceae bacterium]